MGALGASGPLGEAGASGWGARGCCGVSRELPQKSEFIRLRLFSDMVRMTSSCWRMMSSFLLRSLFIFSTSFIWK